MTSSIYYELLRALLLTVIIEGAAILIIFRRKKYVYYSLLCNLLTNPAMNLVLAASLGLFGEGAYYPALAVAELAVVFVEAAVYNYIIGFGIKKSIMLSAFLNALSLSAGLLMSQTSFGT